MKSPGAKRLDQILFDLKNVDIGSEEHIKLLLEEQSLRLQENINNICVIQEEMKKFKKEKPRTLSEVVKYSLFLQKKYNN